MKHTCATLLMTAGLITAAAHPAFAHFGMVIPEEPVLAQPDTQIQLNLAFAHPFEMVGMELVKPRGFSVYVDGSQTDLLETLQSSQILDHQGWQSSFAVRRPGVYQFVMEPQPYWEPAEDLSIIHYTKVVVPAFGADTGWDEPLGLPTEIVPLLRPFGNFAGNSFTGQVMAGGSALAGAEVEVEYYNQNGDRNAPTDFHITQVVKADENGVFSFSCPWPGWWGFAALSEADYTLADPDGNEKGVELGAVIWVYFHP
jgi:cobalt/nickel transport protein